MRADIAAAVSTVAGHKGYQRRPTALNTGDAWPQWSGGERSGGALFVNTWRIYVVVPSDETAADAWADQYGDLLADALAPVLFVDAIAPALLAGDVYALMITGRAE